VPSLMDETVMADSAEKQVWVYGDLRNERLFGYTLNVLAKARELSRSAAGKAAVVLLGPPTAPDRLGTSVPTHPCLSEETGRLRCLQHGADVVYLVHHPALEVPRADMYAQALAEAVRIHQPMLVLFPLTDLGKEIAARTARITGSGLIAECADMHLEGKQVVATCPSWGGEVMAKITFSEGFATGFATVQHLGFHPMAEGEIRGEVRHFRPSRLELPQGLRLLSSGPEPEEHRRLEQADLVVVGGAGLGSADAFGRLRELAGALGAEVGATRPPVFQHWVDEERLIGQTGKSVRPSFLFSIATSGAVQYTAGIMESKTIVAINRDPEAPIFQIADIGVVADAGTFLPLFTGLIRSAVMRGLADALCEEESTNGPTGFGKKVRKLRLAQDWSLEALAQATDQTPDFIDQVENDQISPSVAFLLRLARALKVNPDTFLREEEKNMLRNQRAQAFIQRTQNYSYQTLTPGAENAHLRAFMVTIESRQAHKPVGYKHEGEEYVYVIEGYLELTLGRKTYRLKPGESMRYNSDIAHKLKSLSDEQTRCLVVLYTP